MDNISLRDFLEKREAEIKATRTSLLAELKEIRKARAAIAPQGKTENKDENAESKFTIKEMIKHVLVDHTGGGKPDEIIRWIGEKHHVKVERHSLSPQLSRLRADGELNLIENTSVWLIPRERAFTTDHHIIMPKKSYQE